MPEHPYGPLSLLPPLVAIILAIATRRVVLSLVAGIFVGALVMTGYQPLRAIHETWETHLWRTLIDSERLRVFSFTLIMGSMIGVMTRCGGMQGLIKLVSPLASTRRRGQFTAWLLGLVIFFDDYANTILLGGTLRPIFDRLKISREKLSYVVDSTAAPVAGLALISTWVAVEIEYVRNGLSNINQSLGENAFELFLTTIPYRFYIIMALLFVPLTAILGRDFGAMLKAERLRLSSATIDEQHPDVGSIETTKSASWYYAVVPVIVTVGATVYFLNKSGVEALQAAGKTGPYPLRDVIGNAASSMSLQYGSMLGLGIAALMARMGRLLNGLEIIDAIMAGARVVAPAILILWCASTVSSMTGNSSLDGEDSSTAYDFQDYRLYTGEYLKSVLTGGVNVEGEQVADAQPRFAVELLPTVVFVLSAFVAFATGTSWGTMGILLPMVVTLAYALLDATGAENILVHPILVASVGGVLAGAIFGDHCSPISDTTVLSSQCCGCNHIAHVWTQMPYALAVAAVSIVLGTLPVGYGVTVWMLLPLQFLALIVLLWVFGRKVEEA